MRSVLARADSYATTTLRMFGIPESELAKTLREIEEEIDLSPLEITTCLRQAELVVDIRHLPEDEALSNRVIDAIADRHGRVQPRRGVDRRSGGRASDRAPDRARGVEHRRLLAARLTDRPGASAHLAGSVVAYSDDAKTELLGVPADLIAEHGAVSPQVAEAMADGALARFDADIACAITGIAAPTGAPMRSPGLRVLLRQAGGRSDAGARPRAPG